MKCWKCQQEMDVCWINPWRTLKAGDRQMSGTYMCTSCQTILSVRMSEIIDVRDDDATD